MRASRLLSILILLQLRVRLTADALAQEFGVSARTIYRDVGALEAAGVPVLAERGPGGGFTLLEGYRTRLTGLAGEEAEAMLMIGLPGPAAALGLGGAAARARGKLLASLPPSLVAEADRLGQRFHLDAIDWYRAAEAAPHLPALARAVLDQQVVQMRYESWTATRDWQVEPYGLVMKAGAWYAVAQGAGKLRIFKVASVRTLERLPQRFERPADFDLARYWSEETQRFEAGLRPRLARLRASAMGRERIAKLGAYAVEAVQQAKPANAGGWAELVLPVEDSAQAALTLLGLGAEVEVIEPTALREELRALAETIARHHRAPL